MASIYFAEQIVAYLVDSVAWAARVKSLLEEMPAYSVDRVLYACQAVTSVIVDPPDKQPFLIEESECIEPVSLLFLNFLVKRLPR